MLARVYRLDSFATVRRESSAVCNCMDMLKILHGFIDLIDSSASMDSPKSSPIYKCSNKQTELLYEDSRFPSYTQYISIQYRVRCSSTTLYSCSKHKSLV